MKEDEINTEYDYHKYWKEMYEKERKLRQEVEGENTIIKGIGQNSPEMKALQQKNYELKKEIGELREDNRKLSRQIEDRIDQMRRAGL